MDREQREQPKNNGICRLEWIAWAMDAARRHKETERLPEKPQSHRPDADDDE